MNLGEHIIPYFVEWLKTCLEPGLGVEHAKPRLKLDIL